MLLNNLKKCLKIQSNNLKNSLNIHPNYPLIEYSNYNEEHHYKFILNNFYANYISLINATIDYPEEIRKLCTNCTIADKNCCGYACDKNILPSFKILIYNHNKQIPLSEFTVMAATSANNILLYLEVKCSKDSVEYSDTFLLNKKIKSGEKIAISNNNKNLTDTIYVSFIF